MKVLIPLFLVCSTILGWCGAASADDKSHRKAAEELLKAMNIEQQLQSAIDVMLDAQIKVVPQLAADRDVVKKFLNKHMSWNSLKDDVIAMYAEAFTEEELNQFTAFYRTPAGKKMVSKNVELMSKGANLGVKRVQANQAELEQMLREKRAKQ